MITTRWYLASLADGQTHLASEIDSALVTALCDGKQFRPLVALTGMPPDQAQICPICHAILLHPDRGTVSPSR